MAQAGSGRRLATSVAALVVLAGVLLYGGYRVVGGLLQVTPAEWGQIGVGLLATLLRVMIAMVVALAWTVPVGYLISTNERLARWLQPVVQVAAAIPATALFPVLVLLLG